MFSFAEHIEYSAAISLAVPVIATLIPPSVYTLTAAAVLSGVYQDAYDNMLENKVPQAMMGGQYKYGFKDFQQENPYGGNAVIDVSFGVKDTDDLFDLVGIDADSYLFEPKTLSGKPNAFRQAIYVWRLLYDIVRSKNI